VRLEKKKNIQDFLEKYLLNLGLEVDKFEPSKKLLQGQSGCIPLNIDFSDRPNVVGTLKGNGKGKSLILNGHTNTIPIISGRTGGSDTRFLINYGNTPTVIFGPGSTSQIHTIDEHVKIEDFLISVKTIALTIANWCI